MCLAWCLLDFALKKASSLCIPNPWKITNFLPATWFFLPATWFSESAFQIRRAGYSRSLCFIMELTKACCFLMTLAHWLATLSGARLIPIDAFFRQYQQHT